MNLYLHLVNDNWAYRILYDYYIFSLSKNIQHYHVTIYLEVSRSIYLVNNNWAACAAYLDPPKVQRDILLHHLSVNSRTLTTLSVRYWKWFGHIPNNYNPARARRACALRALGLLLYRRIQQWEGGKLFDRSAGFFFTETAVTPERKVENRSQAGKLTVMVRAKNGSLIKIGVVWQKSDFWAKKKSPTFWP